MPIQRSEITPPKPRDLVCFGYAIENWEMEGEVAKHYVGPTNARTWSSKVRIYVTRRHDWVYAHGNFVCEGHIYPTKLLTSGKYPLSTLVENLVAMPDSFSVPGRYSEFQAALFNEFRYFVDEALFSGGMDHLAFDGLRHCSVLVGSPPEATSFDIFRKRTSDRFVFNIGRIDHMGTNNFNVSGQGNVVGPNARIDNQTNTQQWAQASGNLDLNALAKELGTLRAALRVEGKDLEHDQALASVAAAEAAAKVNDGAAALKHLKAAGKWAFDVATKIGTTVAAKAIEGALHIP